MKIISAAMLLALLHIAATAGPSGLPNDVSVFLERRESCDHWRGEDGYDKERQADIDWSICQSCLGTDQELAALKKKYQSNPRVMKTLAVLDPRIEPADKAASERFCRGTRKPTWADQ